MFTADLEAKLASLIEQNRLPGGSAWSAATNSPGRQAPGSPTWPRGKPPSRRCSTASRRSPRLGIYAQPNLGGWLMRLEWRDGTLAFTAVEAPDWQAVLTPTADPDRFTVADGGSLPGEQVTFRRLPDGRVASVFLADSTWIRLDRIPGVR